ncbi:LysM peptidoglycan-binding domain-containing protein [Microbacterium halotolerans]|uniref:LysM peptidoglycan-binding domain-containing protein n=1 Tax=Microbacterium halotolerans TaxID=246613 RepID=UPI000E6AB173|nr:LysM peptidoglycan-binding domain-containing protein [Microbacterium halotolerans]
MPISRTALTAAPVAVVGSLALTLGVGDAAAAADAHEVRQGETLTRIAIAHGLQVSDLLRWNGLSYDDARGILPGATLRLSAPSGAESSSSNGASPSGSESDAPETHTVSSGETLWSIASRHGLTLGELVRANGLKPSSIIHPGQKLKLSSSTAASGGTATASSQKPSSSGSNSATHVVASGETVWSIAREHGTSVKNILDENDLGSSAIIMPGQKLTIDGSGSAGSASPAPASTSTSAAQTHTVTSGDTLWAIAGKHDVSVATILAANDLEQGAIIYPGQSLSLQSPDPVPADNEQRFSYLDAAQTENAVLIIRVGREIGAGDRAITEALATAMVESSLRNVDYGDRDSLGLFQQRTSKGWGTREQILDRERATKAFFGGAHDPNGHSTRGLHDIPGWESMPFGDASQAVQVSGHPDRYAQWRTQAGRWLDELG